MRRKILAIVLCIAVIAAYMPALSFAEGEGGGGDSGLVFIDLSDDNQYGETFRVTVNDTGLYYDGGPQKPEAVLEYKSGTVWKPVSAGHYTLSYENNVDAGEAAKVRIEGLDGLDGIPEDGISCYKSRTVDFAIQKRPIYGDEIYKVNDSNLVKNAMELINENPDYLSVYNTAKDALERVMLGIKKEYDGTTDSTFDTAYAAFIETNPAYDETSPNPEAEDKFIFEIVGIKGTAVYNTASASDSVKITFTPNSVSSNANFRLATAEEHQAAGRSLTSEIEASISKKSITVSPQDITVEVGNTASVTFDVEEDGAFIDDDFSTWIGGLSAADVVVTDIAGVEVKFDEALKNIGTYTMKYKADPEKASAVPANYEVKEGTGKLSVTGNTVIETPDKTMLGYVAVVDQSGKASISSFDTERLSEIGLEGDIAYAGIDLTTLGKNVGSASIPWDVMQSLFREMEANPFVLGCVFTTSSGDLQLDAQSLATIIGEAQSSGGANVEIGFKTFPASGLNKAQTAALKNYSILRCYDVFARCGGREVKNLGGGYCTIRIPYTVPKGAYAYKYKIQQIGENGALTDVYAYYDEKAGGFSFMGQTLSKYVLTYDKCDGSFLCPSYYFTDVKPGDWFHEDVDFALTTGMMNGTSNTTFSPNAGTTRGMIVTILWRLQNKPASGAARFTDVPRNSYYSEAIAWAASCGIVTGYSSTQFGPEDKITREQLAAILYRYAGYLGRSTETYGSLSNYSDAGAVSSYAKTPMIWANGLGYITGTSATTLRPQGTATRAQAAAILHRFEEG